MHYSDSMVGMKADSKVPRHVPELDGVRGTACIFILLLHCLIGISTPAPGTFFFGVLSHSMSFLIGGVDLFFVLSGLLIGGILIDNKGASNFFKAFWTRRIARIFPVNYALIASYVLALCAKRIWHFPQLDIFALQAPVHSPMWYATFTQSIPLAMTDWGPKWMGITWSLAIEEQFYIFFPVIVFFVARRYLVASSIIAVIISPLLFAFVAWKTGRDDTGYVLLPCRMSALFLGVLVACVVRNDRAFCIARKFRLLLDVFIVVVIYSVDHQWMIQEYVALERQGYSYASVLFHIPLNYLQLSIMFALLLLRIYLYKGGVFKAILRSKTLRGVGLISYALYMYHQAINGILHGFIFNQAPEISNLSQLAVGLLVVALAVSLAVLSYFYLERPIRNLGQYVRFEHNSETKGTPRPDVFEASTVAVEGLDGTRAH
jgi:peptidoglycan/LPS O-acetylase OafA/YrhL